MSSNYDREFDIVIFGASGFVGYYAIRDLIQSIEQNKADYGTLKWALAGRRLDKIDQALAELCEELNRDLTQVPKIVADVTDLGSIEALAQRTKVVLNCVGPYAQLGRQVVDACIRAGTHHFDVSAELQYIEGTQLECHAEAEKSGSIVVSACGWCSMIPEMAIAYARQHFDGTLHSVETFLDFKPGKKSYSLNFGSFHSIMYFIVNGLDILPIRRRLYAEVLITPPPKSRISLWRWPMRFPTWYNDVKGVHVPIPVPDPSTTGRTMHYNYQHVHERPVQYQGYFRLRMLKVLLGWPIPFLMWCKCGRAVMKRHIGCMTCGLITHQGPSREQVEGARFSCRVVAKGWAERVEKPHEEPAGPRDKKLLAKITGGDATYVVTACCLVQAGLATLMDRDIMPKGGVLTPGSAFRGTSLWKRLESRGIKCEMLSS